MAELGRILLADDEETFRESTADLLRRAGYECDCAPDGSKALDMLRDAEYDLLIADIMMPGNPDLGLVRELPEASPGVPVIIVTGHPSTESAIQSVAMPVVAYLVKPVDMEELLVHVQRAMVGRRTRRAMKVARRRLEHWSDEIKDAEEVARVSQNNSSPMPVSAFLDVTLHHIISSLTDLRILTEVLAEERGSPDACGLHDCPRVAALAQAIREAVTVLEKTKGTFKSRQLGDLRRKLEGVIEPGRSKPAQEPAEISS